jgi:2-hydroxy-6-oxonona-2,4-dienedioate hydrolase
MAGTIDVPERMESAAIARYRAAETELWSRYGIHTTEHEIALDVPSVRIRVVEAGRGAPILFVPGTGGTGPYWAPLIKGLKTFRCLMVDRPGWGLSSPIQWQASTYGVTTAALLRGVLDRFALDRADVIGASIGNVWALRLAQHEPERVGRVVMLGGFPIAEVPVPRFIRLLASPLGGLMVRMPTPPGAQRSQLEAIGHGPSLAAGRLGDFVAWRTSFVRDTPSMRHERAMVKALIQGPRYRQGVIATNAELAEVRHPVRMVFGSTDPTGSVELWRQFTGRLPQGELEVLDGAGHMPWWDDEETVTRSIRSFLDRDPT